ncbi:four helix bundle protein [Flavobacterium sp.]|jgi:four helix bundle protein|uniref:four helix bundle protein n=1 Tax=Flavobacterium sp. TaxID=239 RepID=UPI00333F1164
MYVYSFEKLEVWKESKKLTKIIYQITSRYPENEKFGLTSQLRRASISVCSNLAEGSARITSKDKAHFSTMAYSSLIEVLNQIIISYELDFIDESDYLNFRNLIESLSNKINSLRKFQLNESTKNN